ncbi:MAG TPA: OsmC family protein [Solirubrobacteraceae bacterium]|nr:OsmC family protein [Solirubrobacteraceae bacterium]
MSALEVSATWRGGYAASVQARGHEVSVDEPESAGGNDDGVMPTELLCGALASCFCLALGHVAQRRGRELPGLRVGVRAERAERELRYERVVVTASADVPDEELDELVARARRLCWVSNTLANPPAVEYRTTSGEGTPRLEVS